MHQPLTTQAYNYLRHKLYVGEYEPGFRLDYKQLSSDIGVSTTPIREAVGRLSSEGLVELVPRLGAVVRRMTPEAMLEIYQVREAIEPAAAALAARMITPGQLDELEQALARMRQLNTEGFGPRNQEMPRELLHQFLDADLHFHLSVAYASENSWFAKILDDGQSLARLFHHERQIHTPRCVETTIREHEAIFEALRDHDPDASAKSMRKHIVNSTNLYLSSRKLHKRPSWQRLAKH